MLDIVECVELSRCMRLKPSAVVAAAVVVAATVVAEGV